MTETRDELDDWDALAAEYVVGMLDGDARRRADALCVRDPAFERRVAEWTALLTPLATALPPLQPSADLWRRIEAALPPVVRAAPATAPAPPAGGRRLGLWRGWAVGMTALAASLAVYVADVVLRPEPAPPVAEAPTPPADTRFVAVLDAGESAPVWLITVDTAAREMTVRPLGDNAVAGRDHELWVVGGADATPRSLGILDPRQPISVPIPASVAPTVAPDSLFVVTLEPVGGAPGGVATGPAVQQGPLLPLDGARSADN